MDPVLQRSRLRVYSALHRWHVLEQPHAIVLLSSQTSAPHLNSHLPDCFGHQQPVQTLLRAPILHLQQSVVFFFFDARRPALPLQQHLLFRRLGPIFVQRNLLMAPGRAHRRPNHHLSHPQSHRNHQEQQTSTEKACLSCFASVPLVHAQEWRPVRAQLQLESVANGHFSVAQHSQLFNKLLHLQQKHELVQHSPLLFHLSALVRLHTSYHTALAQHSRSGLAA